MKKLETVKILIIAEIAAIVLLVIAVLMKTVFAGNKEEEPRYTMPGTGTQTVSDEDIVIPYDLMEGEFDEEESEDGDGESGDDIYALDYSEEVMAKLEGMDTAQKVSMLIVTSPEVLCDIDRVTQTGDIFHTALAERPVSGLILSDDNYGSEAEGMKMLKTLREWSRESTGMNILLGYRDQKDGKASELSDRGYSLYCIPAGSEESRQKGEEAAECSMVPAITMSLDDAMALPLEDILSEAGVDTALVITQTGSADDAASAIAEGRTYLYSTDSKDMCSALIEKAESGEISQEALDHAAGYAIAVRMGLTGMRPEEMEKVPEEPAKEQAKSSSTKKTTKKEEKKKTPEEEAAEAAQKAMEEAAKEQQKQAEAAQKAMEEAAKEQQKQLEEAAKAVEAAQKKQAEDAAKQAAQQD